MFYFVYIYNLTFNLESCVMNAQSPETSTIMRVFINDDSNQIKMENYINNKAYTIDYNKIKEVEVGNNTLGLNNIGKNIDYFEIRLIKIKIVPNKYNSNKVDYHINLGDYYGNYIKLIKTSTVQEIIPIIITLFEQLTIKPIR